MNLLHVEDSPLDAELLARMVRREWPQSRFHRVASKDEFIAALDAGDFDVILSDYSMPGFSGLVALDLARKQCPEKPFIFFSGTIGEERASEAIRLGALAYVGKDRPEGVMPALRQAVASRKQSRVTGGGPSHRAAPDTGKSVLLMDDDRIVRSILQMMLEREGYRVLAAENGEEGLKLFERHSDEIDFVVSDMMMPVMDGPTAIRVLRKLRPEIEVIAVSGMMGTREFGLNTIPGPFIVCLPKPVSAAQLAAAVRQVLGS
jgi:CheY-like chemotaxis protein